MGEILAPHAIEKAVDNTVFSKSNHDMMKSGSVLGRKHSLLGQYNIRNPRLREYILFYTENYRNKTEHFLTQLLDLEHNYSTPCRTTSIYGLYTPPLSTHLYIRAVQNHGHRHGSRSSSQRDAQTRPSTDHNHYTAVKTRGVIR